MKTNKDEIILASVRLFSEKGFDAVSTGEIAAKLGITKGALYRHFASKQEIFDSIIEKMFELDEERANENNVPAKEYEQDKEAYAETKMLDLCEFVCNQFEAWTEDEFSCCFRKMLTLEQFKNEEMNKLYQDVIAMGPVKYTADLFTEMIKNKQLNDRAKKMGAFTLASMLYAPLFLMIKLADGGENPQKLKKELRKITKNFVDSWAQVNN